MLYVCVRRYHYLFIIYLLWCDIGSRFFQPESNWINTNITVSLLQQAKWPIFDRGLYDGFTNHKSWFLFGLRFSSMRLGLLVYELQQLHSVYTIVYKPHGFLAREAWIWGWLMKWVFVRINIDRGGRVGWVPGTHFLSMMYHQIKELDELTK